MKSKCSIFHSHVLFLIVSVTRNKLVSRNMNLIYIYIIDNSKKARVCTTEKKEIGNKSQQQQIMAELRQLQPSGGKRTSALFRGTGFSAPLP